MQFIRYNPTLPISKSNDRRDCSKSADSRHDPRGLSAVNVGSDRRIWVWAAKLTKLMIVLSHWLVQFMRSFTSPTSIHFTDQKVAGGACATYQPSRNSIEWMSGSISVVAGGGGIMYVSW